MTLRIDKFGRVVLPMPIRKRLGFHANAELEIVEQPDGVLLKIVEEEPAMRKVNGRWVHRGKPDSSLNWDTVVDDMREERIRSFL